MKKILSFGIIMFLIASLGISFSIHAESDIPDAFTFTESELEYILQYKEGILSAYEGKSVEFGNSFRIYTNRDNGGLRYMKAFAEGTTIQQLLEDEIPQENIYVELHTPYSIDGSDWSILKNMNAIEKATRSMEDVLPSLKNQIIEKNSEIDLNTLEIHEVYCLNNVIANGGIYIFAFSNQGNYVFYQDSIFKNSVSYFFTEEEFYEFFPTEYERRRLGGLVTTVPNEEPELPPDALNENPKSFDLRHLYWIIPTAMVTVGGVVGVVVWQGKRRKNKIET